MRVSILLLTIFLLAGCGSGSPEVSIAGLCDGYTDPATSPYVVPWATGAEFSVSQANCGPASHFGAQKYAYDFDMPIGTTIYAARAGVVDKVTEDKEDGNGCAGGENHIFITHADGTYAQYLHLTKDGALVAEGANVSQGQAIGISGNSGCSAGAHLHFEVNTDSTRKNSIPVTFSNVGSNKRGLQPGKKYTAQ